MRATELLESWVVYRMTVHRRGAATPEANAVCGQTEWEEMERANPGYHALIRGGIENEGEAERVAREVPGGTSSSVRLKARL